MNDPHVEELRYRVETADDLVFEDPPPIEDETEAFRMILAEGVTTFEMKEHHPSEETARVPVEGYLRAWEIDLALRRNRTSLRFVFDVARVIDRDPRLLGLRSPLRGAQLQWGERPRLPTPWLPKGSIRSRPRTSWRPRT